MTERATLNRRLLLTAGTAAAASPMLFNIARAQGSGPIKI